MACTARRSGRRRSGRRGCFARQRLVLAQRSADESHAAPAGRGGARVPGGDHGRRARAVAVGRPDPEPAGTRVGRRLRHERRHRHEQPRRRRRRPVHGHGRDARLRQRRSSGGSRRTISPSSASPARSSRRRRSPTPPARRRRHRDRDRQPARTPLERHRRHRQRHPPGRLGGERRHAAADGPDERGDQPRQLGRRARRPAGARDRDSRRSPRPIRELGGTARPVSASRSRATSSGASRPRSSAYGHVTNSHRAYLGVEIGDTNGQGVLVQGVTAGGPAAKAGLVTGDLITAVNGSQTPTLDDFTSVLSELKPRKKVTVAVTTQAGAHKTLRLTLGTFPGS